MILVDGSNGIAGIIWVEGYKEKMKDKSNAGKLSEGTLLKYRKIVEQKIFIVDQGKGRHFFIGRMILEKSD